MLLVLAAGIGYFGYVLSRRSDQIALPAPTGQYKVGRTSFEWTDTARPDPFVSGLPRKLSVWLWYPAAADAGGQRAEYAPGLWDRLHLQGPIAPFEGRFESLQDKALRDVPVATGRHPVVVLEPGMGFSAPQYAVLAEDLASHGYLVAGVTPTYSANVTVLDGQVVGSLKSANPEDLGENTSSAVSEGDRLVRTWAADARFAAHQVASAGGLLTGHVDTGARVVYVGHSFGGAASLEACRLDARCGGAVDLDGSQFGEVVTAGLKAPMLLLGSEDSCITGRCGPAAAENKDDVDRAKRLLAASSGPTWCSTITGARHFNFTDYGIYYLAAPLRSFLALGNADGRKVLLQQNADVSGFVDHVVQGTPLPGLARC